MIKIPLNTKNGIVYATIDGADASLVAGYTWKLHRTSVNRFYVRTHFMIANKYHTLYLHRLITGAVKGEVVDHANHDTLDNTRMNLRLCTQSQNQGNKRKIESVTYKGVRRSDSKHNWTARLGRKHLGSFATAIAAARAYNLAAIEHFGEFALLNEVVADEAK